MGFVLDQFVKTGAGMQLIALLACMVCVNKILICYLFLDIVWISFHKGP